MPIGKGIITIANGAAFKNRTIVVALFVADKEVGATKAFLIIGC